MDDRSHALRGNDFEDALHPAQQLSRSQQRARSAWANVRAIKGHPVAGVERSDTRESPGIATCTPWINPSSLCGGALSRPAPKFIDAPGQ